MKNIFFLCWLLAITLPLSAQRGLLYVKKNNKTMITYSTGAYISMEHKFGYTIQGILAHIRKDSFSVLNYAIQKSINDKGFVFFDTTYHGYSFFSIHDIKSVPIKKNKSLFQTAQGASYLASLGISVLSVVNGVKFNENFGEMMKNVAIKGGGLFALGKFFGLLYKEEYKIGKKYKIALMSY